nr:ATP-grasp domain-containing protein [Corynebacterium lactis]
MLYVVHPNQWRAEFLDAEYSDGSAPIDTSAFVEGEDGIWQPGSFVSLYHLRNDPWHFDDAPWWNLPPELLGRNVEYCSGAEAVSDLLSQDFASISGAQYWSGTTARPGTAFIKLAKHKYQHFVAAILNQAEFRFRCDSYPAIKAHDFIVSEIVEIVEECRNRIIGDTVAHSGVYTSGEWQWSGGASPVDVDADHVEVARTAASELGLDSAVIDTGRLADGRVVVVEANPPWSSGFYDAPAEVVREATLRSQGFSARRYLFEPDQAAANGLRQHPWIVPAT